MTESVHLTRHEAVPMVSAVVAHVAAAEGIRILIIKGPSLAAMNLREPRASSDVDVLCDPHQTRQLTAALARLGWREYNIEYTGPIAMDKHAVGLVHDYWGCSIDLHQMFPGFLESHEVTFEALWARRVSFHLANQPVPICDLAGSVLVAALHLERHPHDHWANADRAFMINTLKSSMDSAALLDLAELASACGAADTLHEFLYSLEAPAIGRGRTSSDDLDRWRMRTEGGSTRALVWIEELRRNPLRRWPSVLWRALTFDELAHQSGQRQYSTRRSGADFRHIGRRSATAIRYLPGAIYTWLRLRKSR